jgi:hypothetical protein
MYDSLNVRALWPPDVARTLPNRTAGSHWDWPVRSMIYLKVLDRPLDLCRNGVARGERSETGKKSGMGAQLRVSAGQFWRGGLDSVR